MQSASLPSLFDVQALAAIKRGAQAGDSRALGEAARQFEAILIQTLLKSMRATVPQPGLLASDETRFYQELFDAQLAQTLAARGGLGLAAVIEKSLSASRTPARDAAAPASSLTQEAQARPAATHAQQTVGEGLPALESPAKEAFVARLLPHAEAAAATLGVPARFLIAQAALESGWGKAEPRLPDGRQSFNLFGVKAGAGWTGAVAESWSKEFLGGRFVDRLERFRAYGSYAEAFADYARLLSQRYAAALVPDALAFAQGLQRAGYATDPRYAEKLVQVIAQLG
ncbi:MAG: flagellar assembly peptidoglycan hydrolase FlgJ [Rhodocyclaceae bacterium]|nr:flagellar assembly peptidoglycan hydrolase FlgJ [Rhodocyclaceae bacterium]